MNSYHNKPLYLYTGKNQERSKFVQRLGRALPGKVTEEGEWLGIGKAASDIEGNDPLYLNSGAMSFEGRTSQTVADRFRISGLESAELDQLEQGAEGEAYRRRFEVTVFGLRAVHIVEVGNAALSGVAAHRTVISEPDPASKFYRRLEKTAVRALYVQGLDFGEVTLLTGSAGFTIREIRSLPNFSTPECLRAFVEAVQQTATDWCEQTHSEILIGMDPEFLLYDEQRSKIVPASRYLETGGRAGCDAVWIKGRRRFPLAELRPAPAAGPREAVLHLMGAMREADRQVEDKKLAWLAGGMPQRGLPLGGHLHFSGVMLTAQLLQALDNYLALPIAMLEDSRSFTRRPRYGYLGDFRRQGYGGFEYRTLPSFLVSPVVTKGAVALALLIAEEYRHLPLSGLPLENTALLQAFYMGDRKKLEDSVQRVMNEITPLPGFPKYADYIAPLFEAIRSGKTWNETLDIRKVWKLSVHQ